MHPDINYYYIGKVHPYEPDITYNTIAYIMFYGICAHMCSILMYKQRKHIADKQDDNTDSNELYKINNTLLMCQIVSNNSAYSFIEDNTIPDVKKQSILDNLLSMKSLERPYILYYLFKYCDFKQYEEYYTKSNFNLDETLELDTTFAIGDKQYNVNMGNLKFIAWVYYSGLYDFLMNDDKLKYEILSEMNSNGLLSGNVFLRYQMFMLDYEQDLEDYKDMPGLISQEESDDIDDIDDIDDNYNDNDNDNENEIKLLYIKGARGAEALVKGARGAEALADEIDITGTRFNSVLVDDFCSLFSNIKQNISNRLSRHFNKYKNISDIK